MASYPWTTSNQYTGSDIILTESGQVGLNFTDPNASAGICIKNRLGIGTEYTYNPVEVWESGNCIMYMHMEDNYDAHLSIGKGTPHTSLLQDRVEVGVGYAAPEIDFIGSTKGRILYNNNPGTPALDDSFYFYVDNSFKVRIDQDGNVGIGTATPAALLDVAGTLQCYDIKINTSPTSPGSPSSHVGYDCTKSIIIMLGSSEYKIPCETA